MYSTEGGEEMRTVTRLEPSVPAIRELKKVAAYCRVSRDSERLMHSLSAQVSHYSELIQKNSDWVYAGVYADEGISGTRADRRDEFGRMIEDCRAGKIDIILTKSVSRFARNTVDLLNTVRELKSLGVEVRFEREGISSLGADGELLLTILASYAQEESRSLSENVKWSRLKGYELGKPHARTAIFGYDWVGDRLVPKPGEAEAVKSIYSLYLDGKTSNQIAKWLDENGIKTIRGKTFTSTQVFYILRNITYTGNLLFQKSYTEDPITKKRKRNNGELTQFMVENTHEPLISMEDFDRVQAELDRRGKLSSCANRVDGMNCFYTKVRCGCCGQNYVRRKFRNSTEEYYSWMCRSHFKNKTEHACEGRAVRQSVLEDGFTTAAGQPFTEEAFTELVDEILISGDEELTYLFRDGTEKKVFWERSNRSKPPLKRKEEKPKEQKHFFTGKVICGCCGKPMRRLQSYSVNNDAVARWKCQDSAGCGTHYIYEDTLMETLSHVLWLTDFDEAVYEERIGSIAVMERGLLRVTMKSGEEITVRFETRQRRSKRDEESNSDSGHEEQIY